MNGQSKNISEEQKKKLKELFPEVFSEDKIDWEKFKTTLGEEVDLGERYGLSWKGKSNVFRAIQEPTTKTLKPIREESVNFDETENLFIEGDNLDTLKVLQRAYYGKVKMIYIDPPYNTGNDFVYNDKFAQTQEEYAQEAGIKNGNGNIVRTDGLRKNSKDGGHFHSNWLNMMYPRLYLARNLLKQDGVIFVSIDDNEVHNLRMIMNEIFGEENFVAQIVWEKMYTTKNDSKLISDSHEYILCYARSIQNAPVGLLPRTEEADARYINPDNDDRGPWKPIPLSAKGERSKGRFPVVSPLTGKVFELGPDKHWLYSQDNVERYIADNRIWFGKDGNSTPNVKRFLSEVQQGLKARTLWRYNDVGSNDSAKKEIKTLFGDNPPFDFPKPVTLLKKLLQLGSDENGLVLDFFSGSGTFAQAVTLLNAEDGGNRRHIQVQLPEETDVKSEANKAGYKNIADIAKERIRRAGKKIAKDLASRHSEPDSESRNKNLDLGFKVLKLDETNFKVWDSSIHDLESLKKQAQLHLNPIKDNASEEDLLLELMLKSGIEPTAKREKIGEYWRINNGELTICLAKELSQEIFTQILAEKPEKIILLDASFAGNNQLKTNLLLQAEKSNIELQVI